MTAANNQKTMTTKLTVAAMLTAVAVVLQYIEFSIPIVPSFLKFDFSDLPELIGAFVLGPLWGVIICFLKNLIHIPFGTSGSIGELSNFILGASLSVTAGLIYKYNKTKKGALVACIIGSPAGQLFCGISGICGYVVRQRYERDRSNVQNAPALLRHSAQIAFDFQFAVYPRQGSYSFDHHNVYLQAAFKPDRKDEQFVFKEKGRLIAIAVKNNVTQNLKT